jgi:hypothetical protein
MLHAMKTYGEVEMTSIRVYSAPDAGFTTRPLYSPAKEPQCPLHTRVSGATNAVEKRKISYKCQPSNPDFSVVQPVAHRYTD